MDGYEIFFFQGVIGDLRDIIKERGGKDDEFYLKFLDAIPEDAKIEDIPLYKEYLSKFDLARAFGTIPFKTGSDDASLKDYELLIRLILASFSTTYEFKYDEEEEAVELELTAKHGGRAISAKLQDLLLIQIDRMLLTYLNEQFEIICTVESDEDIEEAREALNEVRVEKIVSFRKKVKALKKQIEAIKIKQELDNLLNDDEGWLQF